MKEKGWIAQVVEDAETDMRINVSNVNMQKFTEIMAQVDTLNEEEYAILKYYVDSRY